MSSKSESTWSLVPYAIAAILLLGGVVMLAGWMEWSSFTDCRSAGHSVFFCVVRSIL
ncbi:hypothetical protein R69746_07240 [Paraburkholderia aspalathi]|uniref:hypothetical protein n=1 Tax=Paraburkholderia aspalathi TaxID=1324617 RepID=UPI001B2B4B3A|nr:hypothetical protein [Paraburkholderia aspalathi]CAE6848453.1 hypothetical protein R69746_07240 [Paraburkholderia aspalathi]